MFYSLADSTWLPSFCLCTSTDLEGYHAPGLPWQGNRFSCPWKAACSAAETFVFLYGFLFKNSCLPSPFLYMLFHMPSSSLLVRTHKTPALLSKRKLKTSVLPPQWEVIAQQFCSHKAAVTRKTHLYFFTLKCWWRMPTWIFLCFQRIKDQEPRIQISEVVLLSYHLRRLLSHFFPSSFFTPLCFLPSHQALWQEA